ncbi:hypothetical protein Zmor_021244 [Zophobas morio]|uniref:Uncharacterized protein n=1 Tax=Zophobas morio TaxID=2755281 RepID=A0AA38I5X2_9CUCU|nr:hypothetical protein Zmor_021244 [Zophobas morio]
MKLAGGKEERCAKKDGSAAYIRRFRVKSQRYLDTTTLHMKWQWPRLPSICKEGEGRRRNGNEGRSMPDSDRARVNAETVEFDRALMNCSFKWDYFHNKRPLFRGSLIYYGIVLGVDSK